MNQFKSKKVGVVVFGLFCILLGFTTDSSNFIPDFVKYLLGAFFVLYGIFYMDNDGNEGDGTD